MRPSEPGDNCRSPLAVQEHAEQVTPLAKHLPTDGGFGETMEATQSRTAAHGAENDKNLAGIAGGN
jgi:hypothetical protein